MSLRKCKVCGLDSDDLNLFAKHPESKYGRQNLCKECSSKRSIQSQRKTRVEIDKLKCEPCSICGKSFPPCAMDFHHKEDSIKDFGIAAAMYKPNKISIEQLMQEIDKCILVCACCHRILHFNLEEEQ